MDIDMSILRMLEREKEISFDVLVEAIEQALLTAYHKTPGAREKARVELDRKTGHVTVLAAELDDDGNTVGEYDDTPEGFGRIAATTAKQIMLQRLRDAEDDVRFGEFSGREGDIISGTIQQGRNPDDVLVDLGKLEALLPTSERVPGERYDHGTRIKCLVISVRKGMRGPQITLSAGMVPGQACLSDPVVRIGDRCLIGKGSGIVGHFSIEIGDDVWTGHHVYITDQNHGYQDVTRPISQQTQPERPVSIGDGSWIGHGSVVLPGARIGRHVTIGANSVVTGEIPDFSVAVGNPAKVIRRYVEGEGWVRQA